MSDNQENGSPNAERNEAGGAEHLNIKVTDNNNEVFFKIKRSTKLEKLMNAFCERQGKTLQSVRFLFEGQRVQPTDTPDTVRSFFWLQWEEKVASTRSRTYTQNDTATHEPYFISPYTHPDRLLSNYSLLHVPIFLTCETHMLTSMSSSSRWLMAIR